MIRPDLINGNAIAFFTDRETGIDIRHHTNLFVYMPKQIHSDAVKVVEDDMLPANADAVITSRNDVMLGVQVADCVPILMLDRSGEVVAAVHAGWKGTASGITKNTIKALMKTYGSSPSDIIVAIGPSIRQCCYEIGKEVLDAVRNQTGEGDYYEIKNDTQHLDLQAANRKQALDMGVRTDHISIVEECTRCLPEKYHSFRRDKEKVGRQGGFIGLNARRIK